MEQALLLQSPEELLQCIGCQRALVPAASCGGERGACLLRHLHSLAYKAVAWEPADQCAEGVGVRALEALPGLHLLEHLEGSLWVTVVDASTNDACADLLIYSSASDRILQRRVNALESLVQLPALAPHLHHDRECEVR